MIDVSHLTPARACSPLRIAACAAACAVVCVFAAGCADESERVPETVATELEPVYERVREYRRDYETGIDLILAGDDVAGQNVLAAAADRMATAARLCAGTPGCDVDLFVVAMGQVVEERQGALAHGDDAATEEAGEDVAAAATEAVPTAAIDTADRDAVLPITDADLAARIPDNDEVRAAIHDWLTWNRPTLLTAYRHYGYLRPAMKPVYDEAGLPEALLFGILATESGGKVHAYSRAGAKGPLQFMRHTARRYGLVSVRGFDARLDPESSTKANARYLEDRLRGLGGDLGLALAAYNGGETRVRRLHRTFPDADFWDPRIRRALPRETRRYVPKIYAATAIFLDPERYGVTWPSRESGSTTIALSVPTSLGELAVCLGNDDGDDGWFRTLRNLNPGRDVRERLAAGATVRMPSALVPRYAERCASTAPLTFARSLHDAAYPEKPPQVEYVVRPGDTLVRIAKRHGCGSVGTLASRNDIRGPRYAIRVGQTLTLPRCG